MSTKTTKAPARIRSLALCLLILTPLSVLGYRLGLWPLGASLLLLAIAILGSVIIQIINAIWLLRKPEPTTQSALRMASLFALPPLIIIAVVLSNRDTSAPAIHDITTDLNNPPIFIAAIAERGDDSNSLEISTEVAAIQRAAFPDLTSIKTKKMPPQAFADAITAAEALGWSIYAQNEKEGRIEAVDTTFWFGFKDDIIIRIQASATGSIIDLRSVSRIGMGDLGANAERIRQFQQQLQVN